MKYILALDIGTTSTRGIVYDERLREMGRSSEPLGLFATEEGLVEQNADELWKKTLTCGRQAIKKSRIKIKDLVAIGVTNQRETTVAWHPTTGKAVAPAIVWQDRRTAARAKQLEGQRDLARRIRARTGLVVDPSFSATKMEWLNNKYDHKKGKSLALGTVDSWILWHLTDGKVFATEPSNASRTMLMDLETAAWDKELLNLFGLKEEQLPRILPSQGAFGLAHKKWFGREIPITGILGDQQAGLFSHGPLRDNMLAVTYGTGIFALKPIGKLPRPAGSGILTTVAWQRPNQPMEYAYEVSALTGGAMLEWFKNQMGLVKDMQEFDRLAETVQTTGGVTIVPAFAGLAAPDWDPAARGLIIGLNRGTQRAHLCRAAIEAIACQATRMAKLLDVQTGTTTKYWRVNGGLARSNPLMQSQADMANVRLCREAHLEGTATGVAMLAGLGAGVWDTWRQAATNMKCEKIFTPKRLKRGQAFLAQYERALERAKNWVQE